MTGVDGLRGVPTNAELADRAKSKTAHEVVRGWLERHRPFDEGEAYQRWLDWAAGNFLADPEITALADRVARERAAEELRAAAVDVAAGVVHDPAGYLNARADMNASFAAALADGAREHGAGHDGDGEQR